MLYMCTGTSGGYCGIPDDARELGNGMHCGQKEAAKRAHEAETKQLEELESQEWLAAYRAARNAEEQRKTDLLAKQQVRLASSLLSAASTRKQEHGLQCGNRTVSGRDMRACTSPSANGYILIEPGSGLISVSVGCLLRGRQRTRI